MNRTSLNIYTPIRITRTVVRRREEEFVSRREASSPLTSHAGVALTETRAKKTCRAAKVCLHRLFSQLSGPVKVKVIPLRQEGKEVPNDFFSNNIFQV